MIHFDTLGALVEPSVFEPEIVYPRQAVVLLLRIPEELEDLGEIMIMEAAACSIGVFRHTPGAGLSILVALPLTADLFVLEHSSYRLVDF